MHSFSGRVLLLLLPLWLLVGACEKFEYSPNEVRLKEDEEHLTQKNIAKLTQLHLENRPSFRFAVIADTHHFYDELEDAVEALKKRNDIDFVLIAGDMTDFGITKEYRWLNERLDKLDKPILTVIGNHDCQGNGKKLYQGMFGTFDYTVNIGRNRFVFINTNYLEFTDPVPDLNTFRNALHDTSNFDNAFVISHIPPFDKDFGRSLEPEFTRISATSKVRVSFHGHQHIYGAPKTYYPDDVEYVIVGSIQYRGYEEVTVSGKQVSLKRILF